MLTPYSFFLIRCAFLYLPAPHFTCLYASVIHRSLPHSGPPSWNFACIDWQTCTGECVCVSKCAIVIYLLVYTLMCANSWRFAEAASGRLEHFLWSTAFQSIVRRVDLIDNDGDDEIFDRCSLDWFVLPCLSRHWLLLYHLTINLRHNTKEGTNKNPCRSTKQRRQTCLLTMTLYI